MAKEKLNEYLAAREKAIRTKTSKLTGEQEDAVLKAYTDAGKRLAEKIRTNRNPLHNTMYRDYAYELHEKINQIQSKYTKAAALNPLQEEVLVTLKLLGVKDGTESEFGVKLNRIANIYSETAVEALIRGDIYKDGKGLSERIWKSSSMASNTIQEIVAEGLSSGMSAADMSQLLESHVQGGVARNWGNVKIREKLGRTYAKKYENLESNALRLARTTISHSATSGMREAANVNPLFTELQWHSVHAPGRTCQICKDMDGNIYPVNECPFDHPNGLCYQTHYFSQSMDEMALRLRGWVDDPNSDPELETWWSGINEGLKPN